MVHRDGSRVDWLQVDQLSLPPARNFGGMWRDITGKGRRRGDHAEVVEGEKTAAPGTQTPKEADAKALEEKS